MSNTNKLLDMLKSAATPPPLVSSSSTSQPPVVQHPTTPSASSLLSPSGPSSGSLREPSPAPPPPSLQAVSLSDLFAGLTSPPTSTAPLGSGAAAQPKEENHQANLLGMLKGISPNPVSGAGKERTMSGNEGPNGGEHRSNMLNMLKSPPSNGNGLPQSAAVHRTGGSSSSSSAQPSPSRAAHVISPPPTQTGAHGAPHNGPASQQSTVPSRPTPPPASAANRATPPPSHAPAAAVSPPVPAASAIAQQQSKSMFDFVSPFDVFEKPKPKQQPQQKEALAQSATANGNAAVPPPITSPVPPQQAKVTSPPPTQAAKATANPQAPLGVKTEPRQRQPSGAAAHGSDGKKDLGLPWLASKVVEKGAQGQGPKDGTTHIKIDLSKPNVNGLVNTPGAVQVTPMTILRADNPSFSKGRSVGITSTWVAYVLTKGRVRLIDSTTASRLVLQIPGVNNGMALDIAVIADSIAIVGPDHSISVFKVPEHWDRDEPATELITHISATQPDLEGIGTPSRVEWVRKDGGSHLAIGGDSGVIVVKPDLLKGERDLTISHLERQNKVLKTEGPLAAFCLNHSHQAIALISTQGQFTLYNVSSLGRVWHRLLPASRIKASAPSSIQFVESNILVGRDNNTQFDLVQLTVDIAVLSTITFTSPSPSPPHLHFAHAAYDPNRTTLWIAPFSRGSVYGLRYAQKGQPQIKTSERPDVVVFDKIAEYPLEPVLGLVVNAKTPEDDAELFFATPNGFSLAQIEVFSGDAATQSADAPTAQTSAVPVSSRGATPVAQAATAPAAQTPPPPMPEVKKEKGEGKKGGKSQKTATPSKGNSPAVVKQELPSVGQPEAVSNSPNVDASGELKRLIDEQFAQVNSRVDALRSGDFAAEISSKVEKSLKASLATAVQADLKRSLTATISSSVQNEVKSALTASAPQAVATALSSFPKDLERALTPWIQRTVGSVVQTSVDRALDGVLQTTLLPAITASSARVADQLSAEFKSEMVQKDFTHSRQETPRNDETLRTLVGLVSDLQRQVQVLSERSATVPPPPVAQRNAPSQQQQQQAPQAQHSQHPQPGNGPGHPLAVRAIEDHFMSALTASSTSATLQLVDDHFYMTEDLLPAVPGKSPLSQPLLLTLSHRLSVALTELTQSRPGDPRTAVIANWLKRLSHLVDVRNPDVSAYYGKVVPIVRSALEGVAQRVSGDPIGKFAVGDLREAMDVFGVHL